MSDTIRDYLDGEMRTSVLLCGGSNDPLAKDALRIASAILGTDEVEGHPDYLCLSGVDTPGVECAERIVRFGQNLPARATRKAVVLSSMDRLTIPAQNKLLKTLEESEVLVVIGTAQGEHLLPTILSRMQVIHYLHKGEYGEGLPACLEEARPYFTAVLGAVKALDGAALFRALHLAEEKDKDAFPAVCKGDIGMMASFLGRLLTEKSRSAGFREVFPAITLCGQHAYEAKEQSYSKDDFFLLVAEVAEALDIIRKKEETE